MRNPPVPEKFSMTLIHYTRTGTGAPPLVFVHAFGCDRTDWEAQIAHFSLRHDCVAVDLGGHGMTSARPDHRRIETHGRDVSDLITFLNLPPSVIIGNSLGCRVALEVAARVPKRTKALILVDGSRLGKRGQANNAALGNGASAAGYQAAARRMFAQMFGPDFDKARIEAMIARAMQVEPEFGTALLADIGRHDAEQMDALLAAVRVPLLAIQSTMITPDGARLSLSRGQTTPYLDMLREKVPRVEIELVAGVGHYPQLERPMEINALIEAFVGR
jgi:pimeloyl-ACP methyl ester carboxylesterase